MALILKDNKELERCINQILNGVLRMAGLGTYIASLVFG
jgi:hypothetical protein